MIWMKFAPKLNLVEFFLTFLSTYRRLNQLLHNVSCHLNFWPVDSSFGFYDCRHLSCKQQIIGQTIMFLTSPLELFSQIISYLINFCYDWITIIQFISQTLSIFTKIIKSQRFSDEFRGYRKRPVEQNR